jgi:hypothetical protein
MVRATMAVLSRLVKVMPVQALTGREAANDATNAPTKKNVRIFIFISLL